MSNSIETLVIKVEQHQNLKKNLMILKNDFIESYKDFIKIANKICYPVVLSPEILLKIKIFNITSISLAFNNMVYISVDIKKYPQAIYSNLFYPFFSDKYFNIYTTNLKDKISIILHKDNTLDVLKKYEIEIERNGPTEIYERFVIRGWDNAVNIWTISGGNCGFCIL